jgi:hypothetical protein
VLVLKDPAARGLRQGLADGAGHVIGTHSHPHVLSYMASYDVASNICQSLDGGGRVRFEEPRAGGAQSAAKQQQSSTKQSATTADHDDDDEHHVHDVRGRAVQIGPMNPN